MKGRAGVGRRAAGVLTLASLVFLLAVSGTTAQPLTPVAPSAESVRADSLKTAQADSAAAAKAVTRADTTEVVMHHFNHKQQIITGSAIMACLAGIMVVMNNYNPRVPQ